jgi:DNA invertase Pin-like site-specific DNA recombinase
VSVNGNPHRFKNGHIPGTAVLTPQNAIEIRELYAKGETMLEISITYGISVAHVSDIVNRKRWKNAEQQVASQ